MKLLIAIISFPMWIRTFFEFFIRVNSCLGDVVDVKGVS